MKPPIVVIGSSNTDMVIQADRIPAPGETIMGGNFFMNPGGKGANQAVAAARLGGNVVFICKVGNDVFGQQAVEGFKKEGIGTRLILTDASSPSGVALITLSKNGENSIVVAAGSNGNLTESDLKKAVPIIEKAQFILMQLEIPLETVKFVASVAAKKKAKVVAELPETLLSNVSILTPNAHEAGILTGITVNDTKSAEQAARALRSKGVGTVIITRGEEGALICQDEITHVPAVAVKAVDTTAAGDVFNGALVVALAEGKTMEHAVRIACEASAISVTRLGAQASAPYRNEITTF
jgi:ribokinase